MATFPSIEKLSTAKSDAELTHEARGLNAVIRFQSSHEAVDFVFAGSGVSEVRQSQGEAAVTLAASDDFWSTAFQLQESGRPWPGYESLTMGQTTGLTTTGDFIGVIAPYSLALQRLFFVFVQAVRPLNRRPFVETFRDSDNAVGRYVWVKANGQEARMYYEEAGTGTTPLLCQATAGADSRQYRYLLADPEVQKRFRIIAYDLPYHGRSLPPSGDRWWEKIYSPDLEYLMNWVVAFSDALELEQPFFMGCSVGGQLALDLAAEHNDRFGAFISLNGWYDVPPALASFSNDLFRTPSISPHLFSANMIGASGPIAPEANVHEVQWIYASNYSGVYAGDNDYFGRGHDLKRNGHKIRQGTKPVFLLCGEYDHAAHDQEHGAPAVARHIPNVEFIVLDGLSHFAMSDDPMAFREALIPVLDRIVEQKDKL
ncbi:alpha/beta hydrolase fold-1 catalytic domain-containing protein [Fonsecaea pedrosoi]|nr:alpha/beta hydrolase fold-1 catalytic domain-containing protein [Fonsecaea pedrosoi]